MKMRITKSLPTYQSVVQRNYGVYSSEQQEMISKGRAAIVGIGCDGGIAAVILARVGVGQITLIDHDVVETSNLNRQPLCTLSTLGEKKVDAAKDFLRDYNPNTEISAVNHCVTVTSHKKLDEHDVIIQCVDNFAGRIAVHRVARELGIPVVSMTGQPPYRSHVSTFFPEGPEYEDVWGLPSLGKPLTGDIIDTLEKLKFERARNADKCQASKGWADDFIAQKKGWGGEKVGWGITPERAYITATLQAHEALRIITYREVLAAAPKAIVTDLLCGPNLVTVGAPSNGEHWDYREF